MFSIASIAGKVKIEVPKEISNGGTGVKIIKHTTPLAPGQNVELYPLNPKAVCLESFEIGMSEKLEVSVDIFLYDKDGAGTDLIIPLSTGSMYPGRVCPQVINENNSAIYQNMVYDETNNRYKIALRNPLIAPHGMRIRIRNTSTEFTHSVYALALIREVEK